MGPMIRAASLRGFVPLVERSGATRTGFWPGSAFPGRNWTPTASSPITANDLVLDAAAVELGCPDLDLRLAEAQDLTVLGPLAMAIEASSTVAEALAFAWAYMFVHSPALSGGTPPRRRPLAQMPGFRRWCRSGLFASWSG